MGLGEGWGGSLHDLADGLAVWELGPAAAAGVLLSWCEFVAYEAEGVEEGRGTMRRMQLLRGAVMAAAAETVGGIRCGGIIVNLIVNPIVNPFRPART